MITCIRDVRRARGLTLQAVAARCDPPTTAQTIGRLETGTRTVSVAWLNRIAAALGVAAADLVTLPASTGLPLVALLAIDGATPPRRPTILPAPRTAAGQIAIQVVVSVGDYRAGDEIWCDRLAPEAFGDALNRDVLLPGIAGSLHFGRLLAVDETCLHLSPPATGARLRIVATPPWLAASACLIRRF